VELQENLTGGKRTAARADYEPKRPPAMSDDTGFIQAIQEDPEDESLLLVYADWLEERGDVRAEYLRLVPLLAQRPVRARFNVIGEKIDPGWVELFRRCWVRAWLHVCRGAKLGVEYPICEGPNYIGRSGEQPVDIDLGPQEPWASAPPNFTNWSGAWGSPDDPHRCSPQHALITCERNVLLIEDLNSYCGTYVNRSRVYPGQRHSLQPNDMLQIGCVQLRILRQQQAVE
jgi:uncharacterized protein (TIGR02996 family)